MFLAFKIHCCSNMCTSVLHPFDGLNTETNQSCQLINISNRMSAHFKHFYSVLRCENQLTDWILVFENNSDHRIRIRKHTERERVMCNGRKQQNYERTKTKELIAINENKHINYPFATAWINSNILFSPFNYFCSLFNLFCGLILASERWKQMEKEKEQAMKK